MAPTSALAQLLHRLEQWPPAHLAYGLLALHVVVVVVGYTVARQAVGVAEGGHDGAKGDTGPQHEGNAPPGDTEGSTTCKACQGLAVAVVLLAQVGRGVEGELVCDSDAGCWLVSSEQRCSGGQRLWTACYAP